MFAVPDYKSVPYPDALRHFPCIVYTFILKEQGRELYLSRNVKVLLLYSTLGTMQKLQDLQTRPFSWELLLFSHWLLTEVKHYIARKS